MILSILSIFKNKNIFFLFFFILFLFQTQGFCWKSIDERVEELLSRMTLDEKIGQMTLVEKGYLPSINDIKNYNLGALLSGGDSRPETNTPKDWMDMIDSFQRIALQTRLKIPILYGLDSVHGNSKSTGTVIFPHNIGMGCTRDPALVEEMARVTAVETYACGANWVFAPCIAVSRNERWGRSYESYSEDPEIVKHDGRSVSQRTAELSP